MVVVRLAALMRTSRCACACPEASRLSEKSSDAASARAKIVRALPRTSAATLRRRRPAAAVQLMSQMFTSASPPRDRLHPHAIGLRARSEEHTSELQSHVNLVCRLLLEKK